MILLFGGESIDLTTGVLTEHVRVDDIGHGQTQLLGAIRVHDVLTVIRYEEGDLTTGTLTESVRVSDGPLGVDPGSIDTGLLTEHVRLDDIGQGQTQLLGAIRVRDVLTAERVDAAGLFTGLLLEHVRVTDANDSWVQLETPEGVRVSDALTIERIGIGDIETLRTEGVRVRDSLTAERIGEGDRETSRTETLRVRDTVAALRVYQGPLFVTLTEHVVCDANIVRLHSPRPEVAMFLEYGFHPSSFRDTLIDEANCVSVWPLAEVTGIAGERVHDIVGTHHGIFSGSGIVTGLSHGLPEGGLAMTFNGSWHIYVPDDSAASAPLNLSLANGDVDIVFIIHTLTNEATNRAIISKTDGTNGWRVSLVNGAIRWTETIGGVSHFSMDRGFVADGNWHVVQCCKQTLVGTGEARIFIDGVQSGATVTGASQELDVTTADLFIGKFFDGTGGLIGSLSYIMLGREGDASLGAALELCRYWTDISEDTRSVVPLVISYGIQGTRPMDNVAHTGTLTVALDNSGRNSGELGMYSLDHVNKRLYFRKGAPMRCRFTFEGRSFVKHVGRMVSALPAPGRILERLTRVTSVDWMDVAASSRLRIPTRTDIDSDLAIGLVIGDALRPPHAVAISPGSETFVYAMHMGLGGRETVMSEATRICTNEFGRFYVKGDQLLGGVVTYEGRADQQVKTAPAATFTNSMAVSGGLTPNDGQKPNLLLVTVHPVEVDQTPPDVVFSMTARQPIPPYTQVQILVDYRDPDNTALRIAATDILTPAITTDYTMTVNEDGSGLDLSLSVIIAETGATLGGTNAVLTVTNDSASTGWFITQLRGTIIRHEDPITIPVGDDAQIRADGPVEETLDLAYIGSRAFAQDLGVHILALYEKGKVASIAFSASQSTELLRQALEREPGDRIDIVEEMQSGSVAHSYVINHVELQVSAALMIRCTWRLGPAADLGQVWLLGVAGSSEMGVTTVLGL